MNPDDSTLRSRREFLAESALIGTGLVVGFHLSDGGGRTALGAERAPFGFGLGPGSSQFRAGRVSQTSGKTFSDASANAFTPNAWIRITEDNAVIFALDRVEMGQGTLTSHAMMVAEELEVDPTKVEVVFASAGAPYNNASYGMQITGGSTSVATSWMVLRRAAATARERLRSAAASRFGVPVWEVLAADGTLTHVRTGRVLRYGEVASLAATVREPHVELKQPEAFKVLGKPFPRFDNTVKTTGAAVFGIDVKVPGMLSAFVVHAPTLGGSPISMNEDEVRRQPGVQHVVMLANAVAIVATYWHQAKKAADALRVEWDAGPLANLDSDALVAGYVNIARTRTGKKVRAEGDWQRGLSKAKDVLEAVYTAPYLSHLTMEPQNCTAHVQNGRIDIWVPTQQPQATRETAARITGIPHEHIYVHQTYLGGGFGRRFGQDFVEEAVRISRAVGAPVKVLWSREEDTRNDPYRPASATYLKAGLDSNGNVTGFFARVVGQSILSQMVKDFVPNVLPKWVPFAVKTAGSDVARALFEKILVDEQSVEGLSTFRYAFPHARVEYVHQEPGVPVGFWRSVGNSQNVFMLECFVDELAHAAGKDPYLFRRDLLSNHPRLQAVLTLAAEKAEWTKPMPPGRFRGIAAAECFKSFIAEVVECSVVAGKIVVHRVVAAVDCGFVVNPDVVNAQVQGAIIFALSAALKGGITVKGGRVQQSNFHDQEVVRISDCPLIEVHVMPSGEEPTGIGEPGVPPLAPALANALFQATGQRLRKLPLTLPSMPQ